jgi:putative spermidine/putrescine transport system permease protein
MSEDLTRRRSVLLSGYAWLIGVFLIAPTLIVIPMSFSSGSLLTFPPRGFSLRWYESFFGSQLWTSGATTSLKVAFAAAALATTLGTLTALGLVRGRYPGPGRALATALVLSPLIVPVVVIAIGMLFVYSDFHLIGTLQGLILAHASLAMPFVVVIVGTSLRTFDPSLEMAAQNLGAGPVRTFLRITLPMILPSILAAALFAFIASWDEVVVSIFLSSPVVRTLPVVIWGQVRSNIEPTIAAVASILNVVTLAVLSLALLVRLRGGRARA